MGESRWLDGSAQMHVIAFSWVLWNSRLIGKILVWALRTSNMVPLSPPVINLVA